MWLFGEGSDQYDYKPMKLLEHVQKHTVTTNPVTANTVLPTFSAGLIQHIIATNQHLPEIAATSMYEYVYAGNGTFVRARREGLKVIATYKIAITFSSIAEPNLQLAPPLP
jgi:hypothetical protein